MKASACAAERRKRAGWKAVRGPVASRLETRHPAGSQRVATAGPAHTPAKSATDMPLAPPHFLENAGVLFAGPTRSPDHVDKRASLGRQKTFPHFFVLHYSTHDLGLNR